MLEKLWLSSREDYWTVAIIRQANERKSIDKRFVRFTASEWQNEMAINGRNVPHAHLLARVRTNLVVATMNGGRFRWPLKASTQSRRPVSIPTNGPIHTLTHTSTLIVIYFE